MTDLQNGDIVKKYHIALYLNKGTSAVPVWFRIKKSTDNTITMNAETTDRDFIADESPTTVIERYKPSLSEPITMFKGEEDYEFTFDKFYKQAVGKEANTECLIVFLNAKTGTAYKAWKTDCVLVFDNMTPTESTITVGINFNGTTDKGTVTSNNGQPVFSSDTETGFTYTVTVTSDGETAVSGATVQIGGVEKTTGTDGKAEFTLIDGNTYTLGATDGTDSYAEVFEADDSTTSKTVTLA